MKLEFSWQIFEK